MSRAPVNQGEVATVLLRPWVRFAFPRPRQRPYRLARAALIVTRSLFAGCERESRPDTGTPILRPRQRPYRLARAAGEAADRRSAGEGPRARNAGSVLEALSPLTRRPRRRVRGPSPNTPEGSHVVGA